MRTSLVSRPSTGNPLSAEHISASGRGAPHPYVNTVVVGGGQAGLSVSYYLAQQGREHLVLEQSDRPADAWRNHRWDSFTLNTPNWQSQLPGAEYRGNDPDAYMSKDEIVAHFENYARHFRLPVRFCTRVSRIQRDPKSGNYLVSIANGGTIRARNVVMATGLSEAEDPGFQRRFSG
jgi:putative flavoprotein involved in K+ transport